MTEQQTPNVSKDEQIGFHKGALSTLAKEREEMAKIINVVEQLMQMHIKALKDLGVDLEAQAREMAKNQASSGKSDVGNLDELL
jgi:predicted mannosyl-3-phosphoglycerate phosphatase (HAD superfamily)